MEEFWKTIKELRAGTSMPLTANSNFKEWVWTQVRRVGPITMSSVLSFGYIDLDFVNNIRNVEVVGIPKGRYPYGVKMYKKAIHRDIDLEKKFDIVLCIEQINTITEQSRILKTIKNILRHADDFIIITSWAMDPEVPEHRRTMLKYYWDFDDYVEFFERAGFELELRSNYHDSLTMLYIFRKI